MSSTLLLSNTNASSRSLNCGDSAAPFVSHRGRDERHLVDVGRVVEGFDGLSEACGTTNGVQDIYTGVAVVKATVIVGGHPQLIGVPDFEKFSLSVVLIVHHEVTLNHFFVRHLGEFSSTLHFGKRHRSIPKKSASVLIA